MSTPDDEQTERDDLRTENATLRALLRAVIREHDQPHIELSGTWGVWMPTAWYERVREMVSQ